MCYWDDQRWKLMILIQSTTYNTRPHVTGRAPCHYCFRHYLRHVHEQKINKMESSRQNIHVIIYKQGVHKGRVANISNVF